MALLIVRRIPTNRYGYCLDHAVHHMLLMLADKFVMGICMFERHIVANVAWLLMSALF